MPIQYGGSSGGGTAVSRTGYFKASFTATPSLQDNAGTTPVPWDTVTDPDSAWTGSGGTPSFAYKVKKAGVFHVAASVNSSTGHGVRCFITLQHLATDGSTLIESSRMTDMVLGANSDLVGSSSAVWSMALNEYIRVVYFTSNSALTVDNALCFLNIVGYNP